MMSNLRSGYFVVLLGLALAAGGWVAAGDYEWHNCFAPRLGAAPPAGQGAEYGVSRAELRALQDQVDELRAEIEMQGRLLRRLQWRLDERNLGGVMRESER